MIKMNEMLDKAIEDLKCLNKEELEDELNYIREDYVVQIADLRREREKAIDDKRNELREQLRDEIKRMKKIHEERR